MDHSPLGELDKEMEFESVYNELVAKLTCCDPALSDVSDTLKWLQTVLHYNVPNGKRVRGLLVPLSYKILVPAASKDEIKLASVLGWCLEMMHASQLLEDDIVYDRDVRRGVACWHRVNQMGTQAINDAILIEHAVYRLLSSYFKGQACADDVIELFLGNTFKTVVGYSLDARASKAGNKLDEYTMERYKSVVKYKTSYYTAWLPLALAMVMAGATELRLRKKVEKIALEIGHLSQVRKDVLNCFGGGDDDLGIETETGRDIRDGKITWLFVTAREVCSPAQLATLFENYGRGREEDEGAVATVKDLYAKLELPQKFKLYEAEMESRIGNLISGMQMKGDDDDGEQLPHHEALFHNLQEMLSMK